LYTQGVQAGGGAPLLIPLGLDETALRTIFDRLDGVLLTGGGDIDPAFYNEAPTEYVKSVDRERDEVEMALVRWAVEDGKPLLAICRGIQVMNVALGGSLFQDVKAEMSGAIRHDYFQSLGFARDHRAHEVRLENGSQTATVMGQDLVTVNSLHHQGIKVLALDLSQVAYAPDGLVEAVEVAGHPYAIGVQWHPEALFADDLAMVRLFEGLVDAAREGSLRRS
jgi:putative glutamine amidotransferase